MPPRRLLLVSHVEDRPRQRGHGARSEAAAKDALQLLLSWLLRQGLWPRGREQDRRGWWEVPADV